MTHEYPTIVFVCEHGAAKSIVAAAYFNRLAGEMKLNVKAIARGTSPDQELSAAAVQGLAKDGLQPTESTPKKLVLQELSSAQQIVSFCELPAAYQGKATTEQWEEITAVSENYDQARDAILERLRPLLDRLAHSTPPTPTDPPSP